MTKYFVVGGAGFIGSHLAAALLRDEPAAAVTVYDNFSSGRAWHLPADAGGRLAIVRGDVKDLPALTAAMAGHDHAYHFASNPDIARAAREPTVDFWEGTYLTQNVLEAARVADVPRLTYASGSGVYGDTGDTPVHENFAPLRPTSTYGASKLAGEALIGSYCDMFGLSALAFRFANVVGPHQTHGVTYDFIRRLLADPGELSILGDGNQSKSYVHVDDVVAALRFVAGRGMTGFDVFNVATRDYVTVRQIADLVCRRLGLAGVRYAFSGGTRGWKGDVPVVRFDTSKLRALGWANARTAVEALTDSVDSMIADAKAGKFADAG
ncbi:MAG: NAD-dependent dehydratase [Phycisphaerales bacterium]|nr:NAD-dependent dehydratase [Phycisphaerales bacterium]